jgi:hypothetical protein
MIAAHQLFIERRRGLRPLGEMRPVAEEEWDSASSSFYFA